MIIITELHKTLTAWLTHAGLPVYLAGQIPDGAALPYAAYTFTAARFGQESALEVTGWHRGGQANAGAAAFLDAVEALVPESGATLPVPGGVLLIRRADDFATLVTDQSAIGGRARLIARCYIGGGAA